jgi:predicted nucleic acid-binding protein
MIVLDTNVLSELMRPVANATVIRWVSTQSAPRLFVTAITQAEILLGLELLPRGKRRSALTAAANEMFEHDFAGRILPFDSAAAACYATVVAARRAAGRPISQFDAQIASIAVSRGAALATRNRSDFEGCDVDLVDPWDAA